MCSIVLYVLNVCKPQEYPGLLSSYVHSKIDLILIKKKGYFFFNFSSYVFTSVLYQTGCYGWNICHGSSTVMKF